MRNKVYFVIAVLFILVTLAGVVGLANSDLVARQVPAAQDTSMAAAIAHPICDQGNPFGIIPIACSKWEW